MDPNHPPRTSPSPSRSQEPERTNAVDGTSHVGDGPVSIAMRTGSMPHPRQPPAMLGPPSEEEAIFFYYGLLSRARLVGRTSSADQPWESLQDQQTRYFSEQAEGKRPKSPYFRPRSLTPSPIGNHAICRLWNVRLSSLFTSKLHRLPWKTVDVLRMIATDCDTTTVTFFTGTVVVWVALVNAETPWEVVASVLHDCRRLLDAEGLRDVDVQLRVARPVPLTGEHIEPEKAAFTGSATTPTPLLSPVQNYLVDMVKATKFPFTSAIGQPIFPTRTPTVQGSLGLFCWPNPPSRSSIAAKPSAIYAITCRHVGMANEHNKLVNQFENMNSDGSESRGSSQNFHGIGIAAQINADECIDDIAGRRDDRASDLRKAADDRAKRAFQSDLENHNDVLEVILPFKDAAARKIGAVVYSPPIGIINEYQGAPVTGWMQDICVVKMDKGRAPSGQRSSISMSTPWPANFVDLRLHMRGRASLTKLLNSFKQVPPTAGSDSPPPNPIVFEYPEDGLFKISGVIPYAGMNCPRGPTQNRLEDYCIVVGKNGPETGLTWGWASELMSICRSPSGGPGEDSRGWALYGLGKKGAMDKEPQPFSARGDSGSAVFGIDGRLGGFITSGTDPSAGYGADVTYATPAVYVLDDIEKVLGTSIAF